MTASMSWRVEALCRRIDPDVFFKESVEGVRRAKWICQQCPVREACLEFAMATDDSYRYGVFGGLAPGERRKRTGPRVKDGRQRNRFDRRGKAQCGTESGYRAHYRRGEKPCAECRNAQIAARRERDLIARNKKAAIA